MRFRAPATSANLGPGFDCVGVALELWNEMEVHGEGRGDSSPTPDEHLAVQAFARLHSPDGFTFSFTDRIPRERGLGSSAATIALGLVAGAHFAGLTLSPAELLEIGLDLEGHPDNLAAALRGGVCLTYDGQIARVADTTPATPIALIPKERVSTKGARAALPATVSHADAAFTVGRAALLGAALSSGSIDLFAAACEDRLHEPYRAAQAPLLAAVREDLPEGAIGATLSGSGPTVIVWARPTEAVTCSAKLAERFPSAEVLLLEVVGAGAGLVE